MDASNVVAGGLFVSWLLNTKLSLRVESFLSADEMLQGDALPNVTCTALSTHAASCFVMPTFLHICPSNMILHLPRSPFVSNISQKPSSVFVPRFVVRPRHSTRRSPSQTSET